MTLVLTKRLFQVHGSQSIEIIKDIPLVSGPGWSWKSKYTGVSENSMSFCMFGVNVEFN